MLTEWRLREEILALTHAWPLPLLAFLLGALLGWGAAYLLPTPYRAESGLNVMYNSDAIFRNPDDYKNWQMDTLNLFIVSDGVLEGTLARLREQDPSWEGTAPADLRPQLHAYWRNAGKWRLAAEDRDPARAEALARAWGAAVVDWVEAAAGHAQVMLDLEARSRRLANEKVDLAQRAAGISQAQAALEAWQAEAAGAGRPLEELERWRLLALVSRLAGADPAGQSLLEEAPSTGSPVSEGLPWVERALVYAGDELQAVQARLAQAESEHAAVYQQHETAYLTSSGLTAYVQVEPLPGEPQARAVRPGALTALVGALLGLLAWGLLWLARPLAGAARAREAAARREAYPGAGGGR